MKTKEDGVVKQVYTANRLTDGVVVYLGDDGSWSEKPGPGGVIDVRREAMMRGLAEAAAEAAVVVDPYLIGVADLDGEIRPLMYRERIRAYGPSSHPEFAKQAAAPANRY
jgi:hypothetical protein